MQSTDGNVDFRYDEFTSLKEWAEPTNGFSQNIYFLTKIKHSQLCSTVPNTKSS